MKVENMPNGAYVSVMLLITKSDLAPEWVSRELSLEPVASRVPGALSSFRGGAGCWMYGVGRVSIASVSEQLIGLASQLLSRREALAELREKGYSVQFDISYSLEKRATLQLSPEALLSVRDLGVPLSFTVRYPASKDDSDFFSELGL
ncbi:DUF4279 domain-containing protein [Streptomyces sp. P1-3]|uniref:DUF4279 domain-containing protein n=1 Tax=Streptomyces sp. P1-3 TaxID=3421658 RepID=UPI003D35B546